MLQMIAVICKVFALIAYNVPSVSEVPRRGIWATSRSGGDRYALLSAVSAVIMSPSQNTLLCQFFATVN